MAITDRHASIEELLEAVIFVRSMLRLHNEDQLPLPVSLSRVQVVSQSVERESAGRQSFESFRSW
jgi:hypothetical protein